MKWIGRAVTGTRGDAGAIILDDESTARVVLEDRPHDYYDIEIAAEYLYAAAHEN